TSRVHAKVDSLVRVAGSRPIKPAPPPSGQDSRPFEKRASTKPRTNRIEPNKCFKKSSTGLDTRRRSTKQVFELLHSVLKSVGGNTCFRPPPEVRVNYARHLQLEADSP